jgi:toxin YhaV
MSPIFVDQLERLGAAVGVAPKETSASAKLLRRLLDLTLDEIPRDPGRDEYRQGHTLGPERKHWFRAKFGRGRFRLFFRFRTDVRVIVYAWVNDESSLRTYGSRTDAYAVFTRMLDSENPPDGWELLLRASSSPEAVTRATAAMRKLGHP